MRDGLNFALVVPHLPVLVHAQIAHHSLVIELTLLELLLKFLCTHNQFKFFLVHYIKYSEYVLIVSCIFVDSNIEVEGSLMENLLVVLVLVKVELGLGFKSAILRIPGNVLEVSFVLDPILEDQVVLNCGLLLAYPPRVH